MLFWFIAVLFPLAAAHGADPSCDVVLAAESRHLPENVRNLLKKPRPEDTLLLPIPVARGASPVFIALDGANLTMTVSTEAALGQQLLPTHSHDAKLTANLISQFKSIRELPETHRPEALKAFAKSLEQISITTNLNFHSTRDNQITLEVATSDLLGHWLVPFSTFLSQHSRSGNTVTRISPLDFKGSMNAHVLADVNQDDIIISYNSPEFLQWNRIWYVTLHELFHWLQNQRKAAKLNYFPDLASSLLPSLHEGSAFVPRLEVRGTHAFHAKVSQQIKTYYDEHSLEEAGAFFFQSNMQRLQAQSFFSTDTVHSLDGQRYVTALLFRALEFYWYSLSITRADLLAIKDYLKKNGDDRPDLMDRVVQARDFLRKRQAYQMSAAREFAKSFQELVHLDLTEVHYHGHPVLLRELVHQLSVFADNAPRIDTAGLHLIDGTSFEAPGK